MGKTKLYQLLLREELEGGNPARTAKDRISRKDFTGFEANEAVFQRGNI